MNNRSIFRQASLLLKQVIVGVFFAASGSMNAQAGKDTPFGTELVAANFPNSTAQELVNALNLSAEIGSHSMFTWHWGDINSPVSGVVALPPLMRQFGLKSFIQVGSTFLGNPGPPPGYVASFADPIMREKYMADVSAVAATLPDYMVLSTEANLMHRFNLPEFENFKSLYAQAYQEVKRVSPNTKVGLSWLYSLWFYNYVIQGVDVPAMIGPADFIAFTTYPDWLIHDGHYARISDIPPEFHGYARLAYPDATILITEVGWSSKGSGTPELQAELVRNLPRLFSTLRPELVTWALLYDVEFFQRSLLSPDAEAFLEGIGVDIDQMFEHFNGMGLLRGDGTPKPSLQEVRDLVFSSP